MRRRRRIANVGRKLIGSNERKEIGGLTERREEGRDEQRIKEQNWTNG